MDGQRRLFRAMNPTRRIRASDVSTGHVGVGFDVSGGGHAVRRTSARPMAPELQRSLSSNASRREWEMSTTTFGDAMAGFSDVLYARAMEHMADKHKHLLDAGSMRANARAAMSFEVKLEKGGLANISVKRYCAGFTLRCTTWVELPDKLTWMSGYLHSSDGGGTDFDRLRSEQRVRFELKTSMWRSTELTLHLRTNPALPEGTVVKVHMEIDY